MSLICGWVCAASTMSARAHTLFLLALSVLLIAVPSQATCGGEGQVCCPEVQGTARCGTNLLCKDEKCILGGGNPDSCGQLGEICCVLADAPECEAGTLCKNANCVEDPERGCGNLGQQCCAAAGGARPCNNRALACEQGKCQRSDKPKPCGGEREECCSSPLAPQCQDGLTCVPGALGELDGCLSCGKQGQVCCTGPYVPQCNSGLKCQSGSCVKRCGGQGQKCCAGRRCARGFRCRFGYCVRQR